jgi:hypothetical protein
MSFKIIHNQDNLFKIEFNYPNPILINSIIKTKIIKGATCDENYKILIFKAYSLEIYNPKMCGIYSVANMISTLTLQLKYIIDHYSYTFIGYNTNNLIVIDGNKFVFLDCELMKEIDKDTHKIMLTSPFKKKDFFFSPELEKIIDFPFYVNYKTVYFSLGCLLLHSLLSKEHAFAFYEEYLNEPYICDLLNKYLQLNTSFKNTKLYWLICRCLVEDPEKRSILFI